MGGDKNYNFHVWALRPDQPKAIKDEKHRGKAKITEWHVEARGALQRNHIKRAHQNLRRLRGSASSPSCVQLLFQHRPRSVTGDPNAMQST